MKKLLAIIVALIMLISIVPMGAITASAAKSAIIYFSENTVEVGKQVTVTVSVNPAIEMYAVSFNLKFDDEFLKYESGTGVANANVIKVVEAPSGEKSVKYNFVFSAVKDGKPLISVTDCVYDILGKNGAETKEFEGAAARLTVKEHEHTYKKYKTTDATTSKNGKKYYKCEDCGATKTSTIYKASKIKLSTEEYTYNGKTKKPSVKIYTSKGKKLTEGDDYKLSRPKSSKKVGKYKIKITFKGDYTGTKSIYYTINPKGTKVSSVSAAKKSLKVKISKQSTQTTGYQIQYSTSSKFKSAKTKTISSYKTTSYTIKSLKAKKTYYVRVRTYKTVDGKKYYSDWSKAVKKKTK